MFVSVGRGKGDGRKGKAGEGTDPGTASGNEGKNDGMQPKCQHVGGYGGKEI